MLLRNGKLIPPFVMLHETKPLCVVLSLQNNARMGWSKVRYRGLAKNTHWLFISCGLTNLYVARRRRSAVV